MRDTLQSIESASIPIAIDASMIAYKEFLCTVSGGDLHHEEGVTWTDSSLTRAILQTNLGREALPATITRIRDHFARREQSFQWSLGPSSQPQAYGDILLAHGLVHSEDEPGMALDLRELNENIALDSSIKIIPVTNHTLLEQWIRVWLFSVPEEIVRQVIADHACLSLDAASPLRYYLGLLDGKPVATINVFYDGSVAGIHYVVTLPEVRRRGIGGAMTLAAAREVRACGYRVAVLTASPYGINIYRRLGFREYCTFSTYAWG